MIPEDHKTAVVSNGLHFMRSITEAYGAEEGLRLWETIANTLDGDVKGQIFLAMVTGNYNDRIHLKGVTPYGEENAVACIKAIREWDKRGLGLKEAKDMYDRLKQQTFEVGPARNIYMCFTRSITMQCWLCVMWDLFYEPSS